MTGRNRSTFVVAACVAALAAALPGARADSPWLYGVHWWGYTQGQPVDGTPAALLDCPAYGGWDLETVLTHSASWWNATYFTGLYQNLYTSRNMSIITRIDYDWGQTVPSPTNPNYATWPNSVVTVVNTLRNYCHIWLIGNEPNIVGEAGGWPDGRITPAGYATIYRNVRNAIRGSALSSPAGPHIVLIAGPSPGGVIPGVRWMAGTDWLAQVIDNIPADEIDGFAIHSYGGSVTEFHNSYAEQLAVMDSRCLFDRPVFMTEWNRYAYPGDSAQEAAAAQFCRDAFTDVRNWNQTPGNHNIVCMTWFVYDADQQASNAWNGYSIEYWRTAGNPLGNAGDLFTAFEQTVDLRYPAGVFGTPGNNMNCGTPGGTNLARYAGQVAVDSYNLSSQTGDKAIDGIVAAESKWCSAGTGGPHWLKLDLGAEATINGFIVRHAGAAGEPTIYNTQQFRIQSATSFNPASWTDECVVNNAAQANVTTRSYLTPKTLRYVRLYITDAGIDNYARIPEFEVWGTVPIVAAFSASPTSGRIPLEVAFTDQSAGHVTSWNWTFGDGATSTLQNPTHTYMRPGQYTVSLTVTGPMGSDSETKSAFIDARPIGPDADADGDVDLSDFAAFQMCFNGPNRPPALPLECADIDFDTDADVDLSDFAWFQDCFNGPNRIPACL